MGRLFYIDGIILHGDGRPYFLDTYRHPPGRVRDQPSAYESWLFAGEINVRLYLRAVEPVYQRNELTFNKIAYYYPSY